MATKKSQRIGIWIIAIAMAVGTIGSFVVMALAPQNEAQDQARLETLVEQHRAATDAYYEELSQQHYDTLKGYESRVESFEADEVDELSGKDLQEGSGEALNDQSTFAAYYIGWNPEGKVFDSSLETDGESLKQPFTVTPGRVIEGWTKGVDGMKTGGARELTIPADMAYGEQGQGEDIGPNTPLKFVILVPETSPPAMSEELRQLYIRLYNFDPTEFGGM